MSDFLARHRLINGAVLLLRRYFDHHVARDSAALTYYLLFALFPLLIFLNNLVGLLSYDLDALLAMLARFVPRDVVDLLGQYLVYVSRVSSRALLWFSAVFTIYFPYRAANALFMSVRKAYGAGMPTAFVRYQLRVLLFTLLLIVAIFFTVFASTIGNRVLEFVSGYIYLNDLSIRLWSRLRFVFVGAVMFAVIALLYALALDKHPAKRGIWPGVLSALSAWIVVSMLYSLYVEQAANYSVIYGSIGTIIVLLLWLYLTAALLIMGAEFNSVLLSLRKTEEST
ncbi:MAG: YihY/virulence factor BrkB family protein [Oscillospiraceae bacterium]|nr:YihY/virulence factor BrkB family protein [Oscillospiraceae bacterium]